MWSKSGCLSQVQGSNSTKFQSLTGNLRQCSFISPRKNFCSFLSPPTQAAKKKKIYAAPLSASLLSKRANLTVGSHLRATGFILTSAETSLPSWRVPVVLQGCQGWSPATVQCHDMERLWLVWKKWGWLCHVATVVMLPVACGIGSGFSVLQTQHGPEGHSLEQGTAPQESKLMTFLWTLLFPISKKTAVFIFPCPDVALGHFLRGCWLWMGRFWMVHLK